MIALLTAFVLIQDHPKPATGDRGKIDWAADLATAMTQSEKDGRPVITYFTFEG